MKIRTQLFVILSLIIVSVVGAIGYSVYVRMGAHYLEQMRISITGYAHSASLLIDGDRHEAFARPEDMTSAAFIEMRDKIRTFMGGDERISEMYTMVKTDRPNIWRFVIDAAPPEDVDGDGSLSEIEMPAPLGEEYDVTPYPEMQKSFEMHDPDGARLSPGRLTTRSRGKTHIDIHAIRCSERSRAPRSVSTIDAAGPPPA